MFDVLNLVVAIIGIILGLGGAFSSLFFFRREIQQRTLNNELAHLKDKLKARGVPERLRELVIEQAKDIESHGGTDPDTHTNDFLKEWERGNRDASAVEGWAQGASAPVAMYSLGGPTRSHANLLVACIVVVIVFALSVGVLWCLTKIGPIEAQVDASLKRLGGSIWVAAGGLMGCFFAVALLAFGAIYVFSGRR